METVWMAAVVLMAALTAAMMVALAAVALMVALVETALKAALKRVFFICGYWSCVAHASI